MNIYIVGTPRSGTTLIQTSLHECLNSCTLPETHFFTLLMSKNFTKSHFYNKSKILNMLLSKVKRQIDNEKLTPYKFIFTKKRAISYFKEIIEVLKKEKSTNVFIEKTPKHLHFIEKIRANDDSSVFIHIMRSPYENVRSFYKANNDNKEHWNGSKSIEQIVKRYMFDFEIHESYFTKSNHFFIVYDDFLNRKQDILNDICSKLNLKYEYKNIDVNSMIEEHEIWKSNNKKTLGTKFDYSKDNSFPDKELFYEQYPALKEIELKLNEL